MDMNYYERKILYKEVWSEPMGVVAARYGISDVMLKKICKKLEVPTPPRGYWSKTKAGQTISIPSLPKTSGKDKMVGKRTDLKLKPNASIANSLDYLSDEKRASLTLALDKLCYKERIQLRSCLKKLKTECYFAEQFRRVNHPQWFSFDESISVNSVRRALSITESLARAVEQMGGSMKEPFRFKLIGEGIELQISEKTKKIQHSLTKAEIEQLEKYEKEHKKYSWASKSQIKKWDYKFTGLLAFCLETGYRAECRKEVKIASRSLIETEKTDINDLLTKVFILMCQACAAMHQQRLKEEEEACLRAAKLREARDEVEKYNNEIKRLNSALEEAKRYKEAALLRDEPVHAEALYSPLKAVKELKNGENQVITYSHSKQNIYIVLYRGCFWCGRLTPADMKKRKPCAQNAPTSIFIPPHSFGWSYSRSSHWLSCRSVQEDRRTRQKTRKRLFR